MSRLGDTIRTARVKAKMTEKALGRKCGLAESYIKDVEAGRKIVSDDQAQRILKVLGVDNPISTELEVAAEPPVKLRPKPRAYILPVEEQEAAAALFHTRLKGLTTKADREKALRDIVISVRRAAAEREKKETAGSGQEVTAEAMTKMLETKRDLEALHSIRFTLSDKSG